MPHALAHSILTDVSGLPTDVFVNTWHFDTTADTVATEAPFIYGALVEFFTAEVPGPNERVERFIGTTVSRLPNAHRIKVYDMADPEPRSPVLDLPFSFLAFADPSTTLPTEVAFCLSYRGEQVSGAPAARRRGRVYIGPIVGESAAIGFAEGRPAAPLRDTVLGAGARLRDRPDVLWVVHSRVNNNLVPIEQVWVDNAFDTQRRRGPDPTFRTTNG